MRKVKSLKTAERRSLVSNQEWLSATEAAAYAGVRPERILKAINMGVLPSYRRGRAHLLRRQDVDGWSSCSRTGKELINGRIDDLMFIFDRMLRDTRQAWDSGDIDSARGWSRTTANIFERLSETLFELGYTKERYTGGFLCDVDVC